MRPKNEPKPSVHIDADGKEIHHLHHGEIIAGAVMMELQPDEDQPSCIGPTSIVRPETIENHERKGYLKRNKSGFLVVSKLGKYAYSPDNHVQVGSGPRGAKLQRLIDQHLASIEEDRKQRGRRADGTVDRRRRTA